MKTNPNDYLSTLTKRELLIGLILFARMKYEYSIENRVKEAVEFADAIIEELNK